MSNWLSNSPIKFKGKTNLNVECNNINDSHTFLIVKSTGKVFYGQEPPSGESTTTECGFNYQLLAVIY